MEDSMERRYRLPEFFLWLCLGVREERKEVQSRVSRLDSSSGGKKARLCLTVFSLICDLRLVSEKQKKNVLCC